MLTKLQKIMIKERWLSGLKQKFTKLPMVKPIRGFKSYSFRNIIFANKKTPNIIDKTTRSAYNI